MTKALVINNFALGKGDFPVLLKIDVVGGIYRSALNP